MQKSGVQKMCATASFHHATNQVEQCSWQNLWNGAEIFVAVIPCL
jgi:hypothetical protein